MPSLRGGLGRAFVILLVCSLGATVTNAVPASLLFVVGVPVFFFALPKNKGIPKVVAALILVYAYFLFDALMYAPLALLDAEFYRWDGNVFVTFLPVLLGGVIALEVNAEGVLRGFVVWATMVNVVCLIIYGATGGTILFVEEGVYHFLFVAHNAAGGYLAMICAFSLGILNTSKQKMFWGAVVLSNFLGLYLTASRGSIVALFLAIIFVYGLRERYLKLMILTMVVGTIVTLSYTYPIWVDAGKPFVVADVSTSGEISGRDANVLDRVLFLWPRAADLFLQSPVFGTGFGSFNDTPYHLVGLPHVLMANQPDQFTFSSAHAHNSYLHIVAETGLVGLLLVGYLLSMMRQSIKGIGSDQLRVSLLLSFWVAVFSSMTEHRLFTPAQMLPFTILLGVTLARDRLPTKAIFPTQ